MQNSIFLSISRLNILFQLSTHDRQCFILSHFCVLTCQIIANMILFGTTPIPQHLQTPRTMYDPNVVTLPSRYALSYGYHEQEGMIRLGFLNSVHLTNNNTPDSRRRINTHSQRIIEVINLEANNAWRSCELLVHTRINCRAPVNSFVT